MENNRTLTTTSTLLYAIMLLTTTVHAFACGNSIENIPFGLFLVFPILLMFKVVAFFFPNKTSKAEIAWNYIFYTWTIVALIYHSIFLRWSLTEMLFLGTILYAGAVIRAQRTFSNLFLAGLIGESLVIIANHLFSIDSVAFAYAHPSGTIMTLGILVNMGVVHAYARRRSRYEREQRLKAEDKSETLIQLISELSNTLKNPLESVKIKADILKLREGFSENMDEMKLELNAIFKLFQRLEQSVKAEYNKDFALSLLEELDYDVSTQVVQLCDEPLGSRPKEVRYLGAMLDLIFDETLHLSGIKPEIKLYLSEVRAHISIEFRSSAQGRSMLEEKGLAEIINQNKHVLKNLAQEIQYTLTITSLKEHLLQMDIHPNDSSVKQE